MISRHDYLGGNGTTKICVYDSLRDIKDKNNIIKFCDVIGTFQSLPNYILLDIKDEEEPVLIENGNLSVTFTVFEVYTHKLIELENHYKFIKENDKNNVFEKKEINTPWGKAYVFINNLKLEHVKIINSGDWLDYRNYKFSSQENYIDLNKEKKLKYKKK